MKKNSTLQQKLKAYSAVAGAVTAAAAVTGDANAQVIYTDVSPDAFVDSTTTGNAIPIDLNNDATVDFSVVFQFGTYSGYDYNYCFAYSLTPTTNQIDTAAVGYSSAHALNDNINASLLWYSGQGTYSTHLLAVSLPAVAFNIGNWVGVTDQYLGVKFAIGANTHYGWVRMTIPGNSESITVKDFAYNATPNTPILAGATGVGIESNLINEVTVFSNGSMININRAELENATYIVNDVTGREIAAGTLAETTTRVDLAGAAEGVYLVTIISADNQVVTKKVSIR